MSARGSISYTNDILGNRTTRTVSGVTNNLTWYVLNRMTSYTSNTNATWSYEYRADGMRTRKAGVGTNCPLVFPAGPQGWRGDGWWLFGPRREEPPAAYGFLARDALAQTVKRRRNPRVDASGPQDWFGDVKWRFPDLPPQPLPHPGAPGQGRGFSFPRLYSPQGVLRGDRRRTMVWASWSERCWPNRSWIPAA